MLILARYLHSHHQESIHLAEDIVYNLRRTFGPLDDRTLDMNLLLSSLYTGAKRYRDAMALHEEVLRLVLYGDEETEAEANQDLPEIARVHLELLKRSYTRLGEWDKSADVYKSLYDELAKEYPQKIQSVGQIDRWARSGATDARGTFTPPQKWEIIDKKSDEPVLQAGSAANGVVAANGSAANGTAAHRKPKRPTAYQRARASWGFRSFFGPDGKEEGIVQ